MITISNDQMQSAQKEIREWFPGPENKKLRAKLRAQLVEQVNEIQSFHPTFPAKVKLGRNLFFFFGEGDQHTQNFNEDVNKALGLLQ